MVLTPGTRLGPYEVTALLGAGGMGEVYRARDSRLNRLVALKVLKPEVAGDADGLARFEREAQSVASLNHPNILTVHDVGVHAETPYVVTELLEGENLRDVVSHRAPTQRQVLGWAVQAAHGLAAAHQKGIVHRDIKPENLMIQEIPGDRWHVKVLDFGLAKFLEGSRDTTMMIGTPQYMAPEQIARKNIGPWTDLYSVGVLAFELITGRRPFAGRTTQEILGKKLDPAYDVNSRITDLDVPPFLQQFFQVAMARNVEDRFASASQFRKALAQVVEKLRESHRQSRISVDLSSLMDSSDLARLQEERRRLEEERIRLEKDRLRIEEERRHLQEARKPGPAAEPPRPERAATIAETLPGFPVTPSGEPPGSARVPEDRPESTGRPVRLPEAPPGESGKRSVRASILRKSLALLGGILLVGGGIAWWQQAPWPSSEGPVTTDLPAGTSQPEAGPDTGIHRDIAPEDPASQAASPGAETREVPAAREPEPDVREPDKASTEPAPHRTDPAAEPRSSPGTAPATRPVQKPPERGRSAPRVIIPF